MDTDLATDSIAHNQAAIMKYISKQATPLKDERFSPPYEGSVSEPNIGKLTNSLYSTMKETKIKSNSSYTIEKESPKPTNYHKILTKNLYQFLNKDNYSEQADQEFPFY